VARDAPEQEANVVRLLRLDGGVEEKLLMSRDVTRLEAVARLPELARLGYPLVAGVSRKAFIGWALGGKGQVWPVEKRQWGTAAGVTAAILNGAHIVRVHDVSETWQVARIADLVLSAASRA